ncbi:MAG: hypothetical protein PHP52_08880 [Bacteroidales bacterium]|nr:hypothetical protein [Bacteroidales bacterium]MDY0141950.1 hypothetical protein [Bacteroidales bacterium]
MTKKVIFTIIISLLAICNYFAQQSTVYRMPYGYETSFDNQSSVLYNQYTYDNYFFSPGINYLNKIDEIDLENNQGFGINTDILINSRSLFFRLTPSWHYENLDFSLTLPYDFTIFNTFNKFGDIQIKASYNLKKSKSYNTTSLSFTFPTHNDEHGFFGIYSNGTGSNDFILSNNYIYNNNTYGFYGTAMIRHSMPGKKSMTINYENTDEFEIWNYRFQNGNLFALQLNAYIAPLKKLHIHFGVGAMYNTRNSYSKVISYTWKEDLLKFDNIKGSQNFFYSDLRLGVMTKIKKVDITVFVTSPNVNNYSINSYSLDLIIKASWQIF